MAVAAVNLTLEKGTDFEATFNLFESNSSPAYFSNFDGVCKIKKYPTSPISHECQVSIAGSTGQVTISMGKTITSELSSGRNFYDVVLTNNVNENTFKVVEGSIIVSDSVSV